jgi:hypothetical protein
MERAFHWLVVGVLIVAGALAISFYGEVFRAHTGFFLLAWFVLPVIGLWLSTSSVRNSFTLSGIKSIRNVLTILSVSISFASFAHWEPIRDKIGERFVAGYYVTHYEDVDDAGNPYQGSEPHTAHWILTLGIKLFEWLFLALCIVLPIITWSFASVAVSQAMQKGCKAT